MKTYKKILVFVMALGLIFINTISVNAATKINKTKTTIYVGKTVTLKVTGTKSKIKWSSSKKSVATVNSKGKVTAKKVGKATITAKVGTKKYTCKVTVKNPSLNKKEVTLNKGKTYTLKLNGSTVKKWTTSKKSVVTVSSKGKITAKGVGRANITAIASNRKKYTCKVTVKSKTNNHTHQYTSKITKQPTCTSKGIKTFTCSCKDTYTEEIKAKEHTIGNWETTKEATCITTGTKVEKCTICKQILDTETISKTDHSWNNGVITKAPTCIEKGVKTVTCNVCNKTSPQEIAITEHNYGDWIVIIQPTENSIGKKQHTCKNCSYVETEDIPMNEHIHQYTSKITKQPTCVNDGYTTYTCECGDTKTEDIPTIDHKYEWVTTKEATCTEAGEEKNICSGCGDVMQTVELPFGHNYDFENAVITVQPASGASITLSDFGERQITCSKCGDVITETVINIDLGNSETKQICGTFHDNMAYETFDMVNELRASLGLSELTWFDKFSDIGHIRAVELEELYEHQRPNGDRARYNGIGLGENIASGYKQTSQKVFERWCSSSGHYANITKTSYTKYYASCFAQYTTDGEFWYYWVQLFY